MKKIFNLFAFLIILILSCSLACGPSNKNSSGGSGGSGPGAPNLKYPPNHAAEQQTSLTLTWEGGSSNTDWFDEMINGTTTYQYTVYLEKDNKKQKKKVFGPSTSTSCQAVLQMASHYFWRVDVVKQGKITSSAVWDFTTFGYTGTGSGNTPPYIPNFPYPAIGAKDQPNKNLKLFWSGGDSDPGDQVKYLIYIGKNKNLNTSTPNYTALAPLIDLEDLDQSSTYYWFVEAVDLNGNKSIGPIWFFTTGNDSTITANQPPYPPFNPDPFNGDRNKPTKLFISWEIGDPDVSTVVTTDTTYLYDSIGNPYSPTINYNTTFIYDTLSCSLYLNKQTDTATNPTTLLLENSQITNFYDSALEPNSAYVWKVVVKDDQGHSTEGPVWTFVTGSPYDNTKNNPPFMPGNPQPFNGDQNAPINLSLNWFGGDPDPGDFVTYEVVGDKNFDNVKNGTPEFKSGELTSTSLFIDKPLEPNTWVYWQVTATDKSGAKTKGEIWSFKTGNFATDGEMPPWIGNPNPWDWADWQPIYITLNWDGGDPNGDIVSYEVYFDEEGTPYAPNFKMETMYPSFTPQALKPWTRYVWKIIAKSKKPNGAFGGRMESPIWSFKTGGSGGTGGNNPPFIPNMPNPWVGQMNVPTSFMLTWNCGDPNGDVLDYDLYLGTTAANIGYFGSSYSNNTTFWINLEPGTTYFWYVVAFDYVNPEVRGPIWSFTTGSYGTGNNPPFIPSNPNPWVGQFGVPTNPNLSWFGGDPDMNDFVTYDIALDQNISMVDTTPFIRINGLTMPNAYIDRRLNPETWYYWRVTAKDKSGAVSKSEIWSFKTGGNMVNGMPWVGNPNPWDWAINQPLFINLGWDGGDPDPGDYVSYEVWMAKAGYILEFKTETNVRSYPTPMLEKNTSYVWKIVAKSIKPDGTDGGEVESKLWNFKTGDFGGGNQPPFYPSGPNPFQGQINVPTAYNFMWAGGDPEWDPVNYEIYISTSPNPESAPIIHGYTYDYTSYWVDGLAQGTVYYWFVKAKDTSHPDGVKSPVWSFTTGRQMNNPPWVNTPYPWDWQSEVSVTVDLSWMAGDPEGDPLTYEVYFGKSGTWPLTKYGPLYSQFFPLPFDLLPGTTYNWQVVVKDNNGNTTMGPMWQFTTGNFTNNPPYARNPYPWDWQSEVSLAQDLSWEGGDPEGDPIIYEIRMGTTLPLPTLVTGLYSPYYNIPNDLAKGTQYLWQVIARDNHNNEFVGPVWRFTTGNFTNNPPYVKDPYPWDGNTGAPTSMYLYWDGGDPEGDPVTFDVYFGLESAAAIPYRGWVSGTSYYIPETLIENTSYKWYIVAKDDHGNVFAGPVWHFTTGQFYAGNNPPYTPYNPSPSNYFISLTNTINLSWLGGDPDLGDTVYYTIGVGHINNFGNGVIDYEGTIQNTNLSLTLLPFTTYAWKVNASDGEYISEGPIWYFTTGAGGY
ncbi:hypothetical protein HY745_07540 [Candidatus Desantisbacteria bacterium]|nr:hypothetical protein [Candidatus Desantisbacteria bacterium]